VAKLKKTGVAKHQALVTEAEKALAIDDALVKDLTHFAGDPRLLRQARANLARLVERASAAARQ
jgi:hypothetical protein